LTSPFHNGTGWLRFRVTWFRVITAFIRESRVSVAASWWEPAIVAWWWGFVPSGGEV
jgi:hypothetical protein